MSVSQSTWSLRAVEALSAAESWTGRIHVHKLLYLAKELMGVDHPFDFELYRFGPYSFELDANVRDLEICGLLDKEYREPGYGPSYSAAENWKGVVDDELPPKASEALNKLAQKIGKSKSGELELLATCCWVEREMGISGDDEIIAEVKKIKTRASEEAIRTQLEQYRVLRKELGR